MMYGLSCGLRAQGWGLVQSPGLGLRKALAMIQGLRMFTV